MGMEKVKLLAMGTPVLDRFAEVEGAWLEARGLSMGSTNFVSRDKLEEMENELGEKVFFAHAGDNARNLCDTFARLERASGKKNSGFSVAYAGSIAQDEAGKAILDSLHQSGARSLLHTLPGRTGEILCLITPDRQRTFSAELGVGESFGPDAKLPASEMFFLTSITALCGGSVAPAARRQITRCQKDGTPLAISLESPKMLSARRAEAIALAKQADILFLNTDEMEALGLDEPQAGKLSPLVLVKKGAKGSTIYENGKKLADVPAAKAASVVDTTGAGDTFAGGVLWALLRGQTPLQAAAAGSRAAAASVAHFGGGLPDSFSPEWAFGGLQPAREGGKKE